MAAQPDRAAAPSRYELLERLAVGGMAEVFRAKVYGEHGFEKELALKRILPALALDPEFLLRFISEAKVAVSLTHANVVQVFDFGRFGDSFFIAMEYVDGPDLSRLLRAAAASGRALPLRLAMHVAMKVLEGLDAAHRKGIVHRDVSPSNILLSRAGEVKVADFGIAKAVASWQALSGARRVMGKWPYMSPEQTRGDELDARSDVFSAAAVIHELLTGRRLFAGESTDQIVAAVRGAPIPSLREARPDAPAVLDAILERALARDPARRTPSAGALGRELLDVAYEHRLAATQADLAAELDRLAPHVAPTSIDAAVLAELGDEPARRTVLVRKSAEGVTIVEEPAPDEIASYRDETLAGPTILAKPKRRSRNPLLLVLAALSAAALGAFLLLRPPPPKPASASAPAPASAPSPSPSPSPKSEIQVPVPVPVPNSPPEPDGSRVPTRSAGHPGPRYGRIDLFSSPWADVYLGPRKLGQAPIQGLRLPVGRHKLRLVNPLQHLEKEIEVTVPSDHPYQVRLTP